MKPNPLRVVLIYVMLCGLTIWMSAQNATLYKSEQSIPEVVSIRATMSDRARICVEPPTGGLVQCRSVGELRKWMSETKPK